MLKDRAVEQRRWLSAIAYLQGESAEAWQQNGRYSFRETVPSKPQPYLPQRRARGAICTGKARTCYTMSGGKVAARRGDRSAHGSSIVMSALPKLAWGGDRRVKVTDVTLNSDSPADAVLAPGSLLQRCNKLQSTWRRSRTGAAVVGRRQQLWKRVSPVIPFYSHGRGREGKQLVAPLQQVSKVDLTRFRQAHELLTDAESSPAGKKIVPPVGRSSRAAGGAWSPSRTRSIRASNLSHRWDKFIGGVLGLRGSAVQRV